MKGMRYLVVFLFILAQCTPSRTRQPEVFAPAGVAINGYDPVGYFVEDQPVNGSEEYAYTWKDATWYFATKENLETFKSNPEKYAPQYGGYCAYGAYEDHTAPTEPDTWTIVDGKLYLNYNIEVRDLWRQNPVEHIKVADKNWPGILDK